MDIRTSIVEQINLVAIRQKKTLAPLNERLPLLELGLDSLCLAILVASLDDELGIDPFSNGDGADFPVTLGDLFQLYEAAASHVRN
jgi:acyl carrier protein